ncbi:hypothetical protein HKD37_19G054829 [Glycine soja]|nr:hypothetical protein JHK87_054284 [Glycine soja]
MGSPRAADCFDLSSKPNHMTLTDIDYIITQVQVQVQCNTRSQKLIKNLESFHGLGPGDIKNTDLYAVQKELYLGSLCQVEDTPSLKPWQFWMVMMKNGNYDTMSGLCPKDGEKTQLNDSIMQGGFYGTYDLDSDCEGSGNGNHSYYEVAWEKKVNVGSWVFKHKLKTSNKYPRLILYLRADATRGFSGGYHYDTRGMLKTLPESPNFRVRLRLDIKKGGGPKSQFYLLDMSSCWKNNGAPCDGDVLTDVTRYGEMIINPKTPAWCSPTDLGNCPPFHITPDNRKIYRNDTENFPNTWSNPQAQEIVQLLPHPIWGAYVGDGWVGDPRTWELDVGGLSSRLYFYQDPGTPPAKRIWTSIDTGTEIFVSAQDEVAEWTLSDFDVILTARVKIQKLVWKY